jgi:hypothetical protein
MPGKGLNFEVLRVKFPWMNALHVRAWSEVTVAHEIPSVCMISNTPFLVISPPWLFPIIESFLFVVMPLPAFSRGLLTTALQAYFSVPPY